MRAIASLRLASMVQVTGFEAGGGVTMKLRHRGPDTAGQLVLSTSYDATPPPDDPDRHDGWWLQIYSIPHATTSTPLAPDPNSLIGENRQLSAVRIDNEWQCQMLVPRCPDDWFAWRFYGRVEVRQPGDYEFCTESDDGSMLHMDVEPAPEARDPAQINYQLMVDNDGLHGPQMRCSTRFFMSGRYHVRVSCTAQSDTKPCTLFPRSSGVSFILSKVLQNGRFLAALNSLVTLQMLDASLPLRLAAAR